jgi:signal peptidase II
MLSKIIKSFFIIAVIITNIGCDQASKTIVREHIDYNADIKFVHNLVTLTKVENTGAFLSLGATMPKPLKSVFLNGLPMLALLFGLYFLFTKTDLAKINRFSLCCILGGGIGNIYDRLVYGSVTDFLHIDFLLFQTGIFNLADVSIMFGTFLFLANMLWKQKTPPQYFS